MESPETGELARAGEFKGRKSRETQGQRHYFSAIKLLTSLEEKFDIKIAAPLFLSPHQVQRILTLEPELNSKTAEAAIALLHEVGKLNEARWIKVYITVLSENDQTIIDFCPAIVQGRANPNFQLVDGSHIPQEKFLLENTTLSYWSTYTPRTFYDNFLYKVEASELEPLDFSLNRSYESSEFFQSEIQYTIKPVHHTIWGEEQEIHTVVKPLQRHHHLLNLARKAAAEEDYHTAEELVTECILNEPTLSIAHLMLGQVYYRLSNFSKAKRAFQNALEFKEKLTVGQKVSAYIMIGLSEICNSQIDKAIAAYQEAIKLKKDFEFTQTVEEIETTLLTTGRHSAAHYIAGWLSYQAGQKDRAEDHLRKFLEIAEANHNKYHEEAKHLLTQIMD